jgi:DNA-binding transcriptional MerR regulator
MSALSGATVVSGVGDSSALLRIGEAAERVGVSCRTLRYYEELGLLAPSGYSAGGARRYTEGDVARLMRIRELQQLLGFDLGEIGEILRGEDELADIRSEYSPDAPLQLRRELVAEVIRINDRLRLLVRAKQERLDEMVRELDEKARRFRARLRELDAEQDRTTRAGARRQTG